MAYGYIPSPFGGKPSSLDIAKARRRTPKRDKYWPYESQEQKAMRTPNGRVRAEIRERYGGELPQDAEDTRIPGSDELIDRYEAQLDSNVNHMNDLTNSDFESADVTPRGRSWNRAVQNGDLFRLMYTDKKGQDRYADDNTEVPDYNGKESYVKSESSDPRNRGIDDWYQQERDARVTPYSRAFNQAGDKRENRAFSQQEIDDKSDRVQAYQDYLNSEDAGPTEGHESPGIYTLKDPGSRADATGRSDIWGIEREYVGRESLDKSWDKPSEERNAMRTPYGRAEVAEGGPARTITVGDRLDRIDAIDDRRATQLDADVAWARKTPVTRAVMQGTRRQSDLAGGERLPTYYDVDQEVSREPSVRFSGVEGIYKSEPPTGYENPKEAMRTPNGRARAITREEHYGDEPYGSETSRAPTLEDRANRIQSEVDSVRSDRLGYKLKGRYASAAAKTPEGRNIDQFVQGNVPDREGYTVIEGYDPDNDDSLSATDLDTYAGHESLQKSEPPTGNEKPTDAMRTPQGRVRAVEGIKGGLSTASSPDQTRLITRKELDERWDADDGQYQSRKMGEARGEFNPDKAKVSPDYREEKQSRSGSPVRSGLEPIPGSDWRMGDEHDTYGGIPHINKSEGNLNEELKYTGKKINHGKPKEKPWGKRRTEEEMEAYYKEHPELLDDVPEDGVDGYYFTKSEDESFDKVARGDERNAMRTPVGRARATFLSSDSLEPARYETGMSYADKERMQDEARERSYEHEDFDTEVLNARRDPLSRAAGETAAKYLPEIQSLPSDRYGEIGGIIREQVANGSRLPDVDSVGEPGLYKSESAPIHKSIQTPIRDLIKKRKEWK